MPRARAPSRLRRWQAAILVVVGVAVSSGCTSARVRDEEVDRLFRAQDYEAAAERLAKGYAEQGDGGRDSLLYLLDLGVAYEAAGKTEEAIRALRRADDLAEIKDYTSLTEEAGAMITGANALPYKAEEFEYVYVSAYLAILYASKGDLEGALVEARRVNSKLERLKREGGRSISQSAFARYLAGVIHEAEGDPADAFLDYKQALALKAAIPGIGADLWRTGMLSGRIDEAERIAAEHGLSDAERERIRRSEFPRAERQQKMGEIVVLFANGQSPEKLPNPDFPSLPRFYPRANPVSRARVEIAGQLQVTTAPLDDVESVAIQNLDEKYAGLIAKRIAGRVAKAVIADQVEKRTDSRAAGVLTHLLLLVSDQADLRSWRLLPKDFQIARIRVPAGLHTVRLVPEGAEASARERTVQVSVGKKTFVSFRYVP